MPLRYVLLLNPVEERWILDSGSCLGLGLQPTWTGRGLACFQTTLWLYGVDSAETDVDEELFVFVYQRP